MKINPLIDLLGGTLDVWREGYAEISLPMAPCVLNTAGVLHGGTAAALLDTVCGLAGLYSPDQGVRRLGSTLSLTLSYLNKGVGLRVIGKGRLQRMGRSVFFASGEAWSDSGLLICSCQGVFSHQIAHSLQ